MMDLSKLSDDDLMALRSGDLSRVSDAGLMAMRGATPQTAPSRSIAEDMSAGERFGAGVGQGMMRAARAVKQAIDVPAVALERTFGGQRVSRALGMPTAQESAQMTRQLLAEAEALDAPLLATGAGRAGSIVGQVAPLLPTAFIPGANTYAGAALIGGGASALTTPGDISERGLAGLGGAVGGAAGTAAGRAVGAGYQGLKALFAPFTERGQQSIAARSLQAFASNPAAAAAALRAGGVSRIPGVQQTAAEIALDPGLAQLQRTIANNPDAGRALAQRAMQNQEARAAALENIAGTPAQRQAAVTSREQLAQDAYRAATQANYTLDEQLANLLQRPAMRQALSRAQTVAQNEGRPFSFTVEQAAPFAGVGGGAPQATRQITGQGLQDLKMAMDEMLTDPASGFAGKSGNAVRNLQRQLVSWMEGANPQFKVAREGYKQASMPINQMDVGRELMGKLQPASGAVGERGEMFARALANPDDLAKSATGWKGARLEQIMTPEQMATLNALRDQIAGVANANNLGRAVGSNTGQNFVSQNFLRQTLGPLGLPQSWAESALLESFMRPVQFAARAGEQRITPKIANALLDPQEAARLLQLAEQRALLDRAGRTSLPALGVIGAASGAGGAQYAP